MKKKSTLLCLFFMVFAGRLFAQVPTMPDPNDPPSYTEPLTTEVVNFNLVPTEIDDETAAYLSTRLNQYSVYNLQYSALNEYLVNNPYALDFTLSDGSGESNRFTMQRQDLRSEDYFESETNPEGSTSTTFTRSFDSDGDYIVRTIKGFTNQNKAIATRFVIYDDNLVGYRWNTETNQAIFYISLQDFIKSSGDNFVTKANPLLVFDLTHLIGDSNKICTEIRDASGGNVALKGYFEKCTPQFLEIAAEGDKPWCDAYGSSAAAKIRENLFLVEGIYTFNFNISFIITGINLLPYNGALYNTNDAGAMLNQFRGNWQANHTAIPRDLALLYSGRTNLMYGTDYVGGLSWTNSLCGSYAYGITSKNVKQTLITAHEMGHIFGSQHDNGTGGYGTSSCGGSDVPIMCSATFAPAGSFLYFSPYTRDIILNSINAHAGCLNGTVSGNPVSDILKSWSNNRNLRWIATWYMQDGDYQVIGNFDGDNNDEEIFFANPDRNWVGIMDFSCDQGTDWYHLWGNGGNRSFGCWYRNYGDKYFAGDFDGDGKDEIFSTTYSGNWVQIKDYQPSTWSWRERWTNSGTSPMAYWYFGPQDTYTVGDFDGDGKDEVLCTNPNGWAQIIKFNVGAGGWYTPQTIWSNNGNGYVGGEYIYNINRLFADNFDGSMQQQLVTLSGTWARTHYFNGSGWVWLSNRNFYDASLGLWPGHLMAGNVDGDFKSEFVKLDQAWVKTADKSGSITTYYNQNWNNGGSGYLNDWNLNNANNPMKYFLVKAAPTAQKQIFGIKYEKRTSGWWFWYQEWYETHLCAMYRANTPVVNLRPSNPDDSALQTLQLDKITMYPNPTSDDFVIETTFEIKAGVVIVTDITGKTVLEQKMQSGINPISLYNCSSGTYMINVSDEGKEIFSSKIIKK